MTLRINELNIQMRVRDDAAPAETPVDGAAGEGPALSDERVEEIVAMAVRRTLAVLRKLKER
jgi:hypothetical protein